MKKEVVPESEISDSIVADPICFTAKEDYRNGILTFQSFILTVVHRMHVVAIAGQVGKQLVGAAPVFLLWSFRMEASNP
jgi:hypothetical protein